jgi:hypothetical protein
MSIKEELLQIDNLMSKCGYGYYYEGSPMINNGYNCNHKDCEESEEVNGKCIGKCYTWSCPIACTAEIDDLKRLDKDLYEEYKSEADREGCIESDWMLYVEIE